MGIGSVGSFNRMPGMQILSGSADTKSKSIQKEITDAQQQIKKLSSKEEISVSEKVNERKKLQKEISSLNTELKQHQEELLRSQKREAMLAKLQEERETSPDKAEEKETQAPRQQEDAQERVITRNSDGTVILKEEWNQEENPGAEGADKAKENIDADLSSDTRKEMHAMVSADTSIQRADRQGVVIARIRDGIAILKGEIKQDERYGTDTEKKQAEFEKMEKKEQRARAFQFSALGEANSTVRSAAKARVPGAKDSAKTSPDQNTFKIFEKEQADRQQFQISFGN